MLRACCRGLWRSRQATANDDHEYEFDDDLDVYDDDVNIDGHYKHDDRAADVPTATTARDDRAL